MQFLNCPINLPNIYPKFHLFFLSKLTLPLCALLHAENDLVLNPEFQEKETGVIRVVAPGIFDYQTSDYIVRMRAWGVTFPQRGQKGYEEAITFSETILLDTNITLVLKREFDEKNLKVVEIFIEPERRNFSKISIEMGIGWHDEAETSRNGSFLISQMKAKRAELGIWKYGEFHNSSQVNKQLTTPLLRTMVKQNPFSPGVNYWVTSFGKIHKPSCSFYERGRGKLSRRPTGTDCRICGGTNP
jgi:hypothetical protein